MRRILISAMSSIAIFTGGSQSAQASGFYLQMLHNNSAATVELSGKLPAGWVNTPKYPMTLLPGHSWFDEKVYDDAYYKRCRHEIRNVAVPRGGSCANDTYLQIVVGKTHYYKLYDCNWKITVLKKEGNEWKWHQAIDVHAHTFFWAAYVEKNGNLVITSKQDDTRNHDECRRGC